MARRKKKRGRGSTTHGKGSSKRNRGAGNRGGRGNAGSGKKAGHENFRVIKDGVEEKGFSSRQQIRGETPDVVNLRDIDTMIPRLEEEGIAFEEDGDLVIDLGEAGYDKVLGTGTLHVAATVKAPSFSASAKQKLEDTGSTPVETSESA
jgi:large subunit ribosomal protein L15